jgi:hypothetical protein
MKKWLRRIRGLIGMGLTWAVGWALFGVLIGIASILLPGLPWDIFFDVFDAPLPALAVPGFVGGAAFSTVLGVLGRRRRFDEMSLPRFALWGALGGFLVMVPIMAALGFSSLSMVVASIMTLLCSGSAAGSLALARISEDQELLDASADVAHVGLTGDEAEKLLGGS